MDYNILNEDFSAQIESNQKAVRNEVISQYIKARKSRMLTQEQVAAVSGIKRTNITRFESGAYNPTLDMMVRIAECIGMKVEVKLVEKSQVLGSKGDKVERKTLSTIEIESAKTDMGYKNER